MLIIGIDPGISGSICFFEDGVIKDVIEKPSIKNAPSKYAVIGRYILPYKIFRILKNQKAGQNGEIHITDAIRNLIHNNNNFIGHIFSGKYFLSITTS